jgi:phospholipid/cholesterol/gamma-HCH transport system substrate-binding protein
MKKRGLNIRKHLVEIKVGIFLIGAIFLLFIAAVSIKEVSFLRGSYILKIKFDFAEGLKPASPVRFCGVDVGEIKKVEVKESNRKLLVYVHAKIERGIRIPKGSKFFINSLSLFGEKYLEIIPPQIVSTYLREEEVVEGESGVPLFNIMSSFHKTMVKVDDFIKETKLQESLKDIVLNIKDVSRDFRDILEGIKNKEGTLGMFIYDDALYIEAKEFMEDLKLHPWKLLYKPKEK